MNLEKQLISLRYWFLGKEYYVALQAMEFASKYHVGTRKDGKTPEFSNQIALCHFARSISRNLIKPQETFASLLLHDVSEDYDIAIEILEKKFGKQISIPVYLLSKKIGGVKKELKFYYEEISEDPVASIDLTE